MLAQTGRTVDKQSDTAYNNIGRCGTQDEMHAYVLPPRFSFRKGEKKMKILICTTRMSIGGAETHVLTLASELVRRGNSVTVISAGGELTEELEARGVVHIRAPLDRKDPLSLLVSAKKISQAAKGAGIVSVHGRIPSFVCSFLSRKASFPPVVTTAHGLYDPAPPKGPLTFFGDSVIAVSEDVAAHLRNVYRVPGEKIRVIGNGVDIPGRPAELPADGLHIASSGRLDPDTLPLFLGIIKTVGRLLDENRGAKITLKIIGGGASQKDIEAAAAAINARYPGAVSVAGPSTNVPYELTGANVYAGQSRGAIEAAAAGLCVIPVSPRGCAGVLSPDNAEDMLRTNFIPSDGRDPFETLKEALSELIHNPERISDASESARRFAAENCGIERAVGDTLEVFKKTIAARRPGIMLCGYFGAGNAGDDATLSMVLSHIKDAFPGTPVTVIAAGKKRMPDGAEYVGRWSIIKALRRMRSTRLFLLCGGSLIQNSTSTRSLAYYRFLQRAAKKRGCLTGIYGGGVGPLKGSCAGKIATRLLSSLDSACLRDRESLEYVSKYFPDAILGADPALDYAGPCDAYKRERILTVSLRPFPRGGQDKVFFESVKRALRAVAEKENLRLRFAAFSPEDEKICRRFAKDCSAEYVRCDSFEDAYKAVATSEKVIAMRLHAAVFAVTSGTPAVCLAYDPKVSSFASEAGLPSVDASSRTDVEAALAAAAERAATPEPKPDFHVRMEAQKAEPARMMEN